MEHVEPLQALECLMGEGRGTVAMFESSSYEKEVKMMSTPEKAVERAIKRAQAQGDKGWLEMSKGFREATSTAPYRVAVSHMDSKQQQRLADAVADKFTMANFTSGTASPSSIGQTLHGASESYLKEVQRRLKTPKEKWWNK